MIVPKPKVCNLCGGDVKLVNNSVIYGKSYGNGKAYLCQKCGAYVGVVPGFSNRALGILANSKMRSLKVACHALFDPYWQSHKMSRSEAYRRLAADMNLEVRDCHFGYFDEPTLKKALFIVASWE